MKDVLDGELWLAPGDKLSLKVGDKLVKVQVGLTMTVIGSKDAPRIAPGSSVDRRAGADDGEGGDSPSSAAWHIARTTPFAKTPDFELRGVWGMIEFLTKSPILNHRRSP